MAMSFLQRESGRKQEVLRPAVAVIVADMLRSAVDEVGGTGHRIRTTYDFRTQGGRAKRVRPTTTRMRGSSASPLISSLGSGLD